MNRRDFAFLAVLWAAIALAYGPSLKHPPRADQWCFLADTRHDHTFGELLRNHYSYNRTRLTGPGDTDLFRPLLFAVLAAERAAFEGHISPPQLLSIGLHCAVCTLLLLSLKQTAAVVRPKGEAPAGADWFNYGLVAFFALNPYTQELVIWAHLHGYLVFLILVFGAVACVNRYARGGNSRWLTGAWALACASAFTYELGQLFAVLLGASAALLAAPRVGSAKAAGVAVGFASILVGYQLADRIDAQAHHGRYEPENLKPVILDCAFRGPTVTNSVRFAVFTGVQPFFPALVKHSYAGQRLEVAEHFWRTRKHVKMPTPVTAVSAATYFGLLGLALVGLRALAREPSRAAAVALLLPLALYALYAGMAVLGRMNLRPTAVILSSNSYYAYTALAFLLLAAGAAWHAVGPRADAVRKWLAAGLLVLAAAGSERVHQANVMIADLDRDWSRAVATVQEFVDAHRHEPDFSFAIDYPVSEPVPVIHRLRLPEIVFGRWMPAANPKYRVVLRDGKAHIVPPTPAAPGPRGPTTAE
jgi:hypothetical protein